MVAELKNYQSQVHAYKFEIERLDRNIGETKELYFNIRKQQKMGVIPEGDEMDEQDMSYPD